MSKNLLTKFRKFWRTLSPLEQKRLYDIFTALRGEDGGNSSLKYRTTARIRGLLFGRKLQYKGVRGFFRPDPYDDLTNAPYGIFQGASLHFRNHIKTAIIALKPYIKKEEFTDLLKFL